jgi:phospholipid transport system substrate-binding protein
MRKGWIGLIVTAAFLIVPLQVDAGVPLETIEKNVNRVLDVLRDGKLDESAKKEKIKSISEDIFDYEELAKRTLSRNYRKFSAEQKKEFTSLFGGLLEKIYIDRIMTYTNETVNFTKETKLTETKYEVHSEIVTQSKTIPINYRMIQKNEKWKVYDVVIEGISLVKNYRTQFRDILVKKKPEDLLQILRDKVKKE